MRSGTETGESGVEWRDGTDVFFGKLSERKGAEQGRLAACALTSQGG